MNDRQIEIKATIDLDAVDSILKNAATLDDNQPLFTELARVEQLKAELKQATKDFETYEAEIKAMIKARGIELYGDEWESIKGDGYKINRQKTGAVYVVSENGTPSKDFVEVKYAIDRKKVETYMGEKGKLPKDIEPNPKRGDSIRIYLDTDKAEVA